MKKLDLVLIEAYYDMLVEELQEIHKELKAMAEKYGKKLANAETYQENDAIYAEATATMRNYFTTSVKTVVNRAMRETAHDEDSEKAMTADVIKFYKSKKPYTPSSFNCEDIVLSTIENKAREIRTSKRMNEKFRALRQVE